MKCVFVMGPDFFTVQYHSPVIALDHSDGWMHEVGGFPCEFSSYEGYPAVFRHGGIGVFLPTELSQAKRRRLFERFTAANPNYLPPPNPPDPPRGVD